jgi:hypothetical protein
VVTEYRSQDAAAPASWRQALALLTDIGGPEAHQVQAELRNGSE